MACAGNILDGRSAYHNVFERGTMIKCIEVRASSLVFAFSDMQMALINF